jgi:hypothetical protein
VCAVGEVSELANFAVNGTRISVASNEFLRLRALLATKVPLPYRVADPQLLTAATLRIAWLDKCPVVEDTVLRAVLLRAHLVLSSSRARDAIRDGLYIYGAVASFNSTSACFAAYVPTRPSAYNAVNGTVSRVAGCNVQSIGT